MLSLLKSKLPHCDELFKKFIAPWFEQENQRFITRPDLYQIEGYEGEPLDLNEIQYLTPELLFETKQLLCFKMVDALLNDFQHISKHNKPDLKLLDAVDKYYNRERIISLIKNSNSKDYTNSYLVTVCELGTLLGQIFRESDDFDWLYSNPYFNSIIVHKETGIAITVFDWAVKKLSSYGIEDGLVSKFHAAIKSIKEFNN